MGPRPARSKRVRGRDDRFAARNTLTGIGLLLGALVRWNALCAAAMMLLFWASSLPLEHAILVDQHVVYAAVLVGFAALNVGKAFGVDAYLARTETVRNSPALRTLIG